MHPPHFFSVYDLQSPEDDGDIFERLTPNHLSGSAEEIVIRSLTIECLREEFQQLSKKDQEILGRCFGVYGHPKSDLREIAMRNRMKESGVEKAKNQTIQRLRERCLDSLAWKLRRARRMVGHAAHYNMLSSKEIEVKKCERMFKVVGGIKNARRFAKEQQKRK